MMAALASLAGPTESSIRAPPQRAVTGLGWAESASKIVFDQGKTYVHKIEMIVFERMGKLERLETMMFGKSPA